MPRKQRPILASLVVVVALAACGGGGGDGGADTANPASYDAAYDICAGGLEQTADLYAVPVNREAVTKIVAEQVSGGQPQDADAAVQGCGDALDGKPRRSR